MRPSEDGGQRVPRGTPLGIYGGELLSREEIHKRQMSDLEMHPRYFVFSSFTDEQPSSFRKYDVLRRNYLYGKASLYSWPVADEIVKITHNNDRYRLLVHRKSRGRVKGVHRDQFAKTPSKPGRQLEFFAKW